MNKKQITLRQPKELNDKLKVIAERKQNSYNNTVRQAVEKEMLRYDFLFQ